LKGIIDKLDKEEKVPSHIITSMDSLNRLATFGTHPKEYDPEQVRPVLINLSTVFKWYLKFKNIGFYSPAERKTKKVEIFPIKKEIVNRINQNIFLISVSNCPISAQKGKILS